MTETTKAFNRLFNEVGLSSQKFGEKVGKSRQLVEQMKKTCSEDNLKKTAKILDYKVEYLIRTIKNDA